MAAAVVVVVVVVVVALVVVVLVVVFSGRGGLLGVVGSGTGATASLRRLLSLSRTDLLRPRSANDLDLFFLMEGRGGVVSASPEDETERLERDG